MSKLIVDFTEIKEISPHPNADRLEIAKIKGWQVVVGKDSFKVGDNIIFIPPDAILPEHVHEHLGITKYLAELPKGYGGLPENERPKARRVRAARLRGQASYGTVMKPVDATILAGLDQQEFGGWDQVDDIAEQLGITKWEPPIKSTQGDVAKDIVTFHKYTDIENWRNFPDVIQAGEKVSVTEKLHGTNCRIGYVKEPGSAEDSENIFVAGSHNTRRKEFDLKDNQTLYWKPFDWYPSIKNMLKAISKNHGGASVVVFGEIYGSSVQDMAYGLSNGQKDFRAFDIAVDGEYLNFDVKRRYLSNWKVPMVPILWTGPFASDKIEELTDGDTTFEVKQGFTGREGVVITPLFERNDDTIGRVILKSISADYLARKGGTDSH